MSGGPILNNGTQFPAKKSNVLRLKKRNISYKGETKEEKEIYKDILDKEIITKTRKRGRFQKRCYGSSLVAIIQL